jgi:hypothetical protein
VVLFFAIEKVVNVSHPNVHRLKEGQPMTDQRRCTVCNDPTAGGRWCGRVCRAIELQPLADELVVDFDGGNGATICLIQSLEDYTEVACMFDDELRAAIGARRRQAARASEDAAEYKRTGRMAIRFEDAEQIADSQLLVAFWFDDE